MSVALLAAFLVSSCSSVGAFIGDNLPTWAGGLPPGTPPRPGTPEYDAYLKSVGIEQRANAAHPQPVETPPAPPAARKATEPVDEPIH